jgi:tripartite-type tricarboxylate transporter receptor subunit TctC
MRVLKHLCLVCLGAAALVALSLAPSAKAQDYPSRPVQVISPAAAGNSPDVAMRIVADRLGVLWKQQLVIMNRPGGGGLIAAQASTFTVLPITQDKMPLDLHASFTPIGLIAEQAIAVSVNPSLGINSIAELIARIKQSPEGMQFGASNRGGISHLTGELFARKTGLKLSFISASGASTSINDVAAGRIPIIFEGIAAVAGATQGGLLKTIAVAFTKRLPNYPDIPTVAETIPGFETKGWLALMAPAGTPDRIVQQISTDLRTVLADAEVQEKLAVLGSYAHALTPAETTAFIKAEEDLWWPIVKEVGIIR